MSKIVIARGIAMPFFPMRPINLRSLKSDSDIEEFIEKSLKTGEWVVQPKLNGDRAVLAFVDGQLLIQNRYGGWYKHRIKNLESFKKLPNRTVLDGEIFKGNFYPFDCLSVYGKSQIFSTVEERDVLAFKICQFINVEWRFKRPSVKWLRDYRKQDLLEYDGVVLKRSRTQYFIAGSENEAHAAWAKRTWI